MKTPGQTRAKSSIDRLYQAVVRNPDDSESVFQLTQQLIDRERYFEAYDQLSGIENDNLVFIRVDVVKAGGQS